MTKDCLLPELGENIETATIVDVMIAVGDVVEVDQPVLSLETDKAEFELPSPQAGRVSEVLVAAGDEVRVGQVIFRVEDSAASAERAPEKQAGDAAAATKSGRGASAPPERRAPAPKRDAEGEKAGAAGPEGEEGKRAGEPRGSGREPAARARRGAPLAPDESQDDATRPVQEPAVPAGAALPRSSVVGAPPVREAEGGDLGSAAALPASPSVRRLAREFGVDLRAVAGRGESGRISVDDVQRHVRDALATPGRDPGSAVAEQPDFSRFGPTESVPMSKVRRRTAEQMTRAWNGIPHVTHHDKADITELDRLRKQFARRVEAAGGKLTLTAVLLKVLGAALRKFPKFNASVDMANSAIIYKKYVHVGVAVDTARGLLVPVIRDVDQKNIVELALELRDVSERARNRNIRPELLQGASFTITNLGGIGGTAFSPLINPPEVAVLGVSSAGTEPVWVGGEFEPRLMMPLSVSYDHRVIDGADAARFLRWVCEALGEPFLMDLEGQ